MELERDIPLSCLLGFNHISHECTAEKEIRLSSNKIDLMNLIHSIE